MSKIIDYIEKQRKAKQIDKQLLSKTAGISRNTYSNMLRSGKCNVDVMERLIDSLNIDILLVDRDSNSLFR